MLRSVHNNLCARLTAELLVERSSTLERSSTRSSTTDRGSESEPGFEIAQSMGIALLGLVVAAAFATALEALGVDVITRIRTELGL